MSARVIGRGAWLDLLHGMSDAAISGQLPDFRGASISSQPNWVEPLPPEWPSWRQNFAFECAWTKSTMRLQASTCPGAYMPVHPGVIRAVGETQVISVNSNPAPPCARVP